MIEIKDNFLSSSDFKSIEENIFNNSYFPWFKQDSKVFNDDGETQLTHNFYGDLSPKSNFLQYLKPIIDNLKPVALVRIKGNLSFKENNIRSYLFHTDQPPKLKNLKTGIFYLNTNNGKTIFENNQKISSVKNRMVIFPNHISHTGTTHTDVNYRCVINFNWY